MPRSLVRRAVLVAQRVLESRHQRLRSSGSQTIPEKIPKTTHQKTISTAPYPLRPQEVPEKSGMRPNPERTYSIEHEWDSQHLYIASDGPRHRGGEGFRRIYHIAEVERFLRKRKGTKIGRFGVEVGHGDEEEQVTRKHPYTCLHVSLRRFDVGS